MGIGERKPAHEPVLVEEVLEHLACAPGQVVADATVGSGGHAAAILERISPGGWLIGIDRDPEAIERARERLAGHGRVTLINENYARLEEILDDLGVDVVDGVLIDCGASMEQLTTGRRGFSFRSDGPLDMRMNPEDPVTAADLVNELPEDELAKILWEYGGERRARRIAQAIATARQQHRITTTAQLAAIITATMPARARPRRLHAATKSFMALRIAVNDELGALRAALDAALHRTKRHGRIVVLTYQSLEGRETKGAFRRATSRSTGLCPPFPSEETEPEPRVRILTRKVVKPSPEEMSRNPRARSATLRAAERL
jgi:16S rRNA (cytosine1402-N4)-methyltransferase